MLDLSHTPMMVNVSFPLLRSNLGCRDPLPDPQRPHSLREICCLLLKCKQIASGSYNWTVQIWDAEHGQRVGEPIVGHTEAVTSVAFSSDVRHVASGSWDITILIWDSETHEQAGETLRGHISSVRCVAFPPDRGRNSARTIFISHLWH
jgi:WD40 repeat protein